MDFIKDKFTTLQNAEQQRLQELRQQEELELQRKELAIIYTENELREVAGALDLKEAELVEKKTDWCNKKK